ncbi:hypothetical protein QWY26_11945 [Acinetobacter baumannii]|uniref:hypothetical protein n=1 Tax=Acinetobacter baumannii TaxID=470 RepID=UPI002607AF76|nr:hypothetical protein [Acinetobacter baumannii]WKA70440.1 hypothetical protein QWY26_11945 [Acinetobacter baumannii]
MSSNSFEQHQLFQEEIIFDQFLYTYWDKHSRLGQIQELALPERKKYFRHLLSR